MKLLTSLFLVSAMIAPLQAKKLPKEVRKANAKERVEDRKKEQRDNKEAAALEALLSKKDDNNDQALTREEYLRGEANAEAANKKFDTFNLNKDRILSKSELLKLLGF